MKNLLFLLVVLSITFGCHSDKKDDSEIALIELQSELNYKNDSIAILVAQLNRRIAVENTVKGEELQPLEESTPSIITTVTENLTTYKLYQKPIIREIKDAEFAEVISSTDTITIFRAEEFIITAASVCNGPADPDLDYCNCSNFVYLVTATYGEYSDYQLFKIGPFVEPQFKGWKKDKEKPELKIEHDVKGKKRTDTFSITLEGVKQI